MVLECIGPWRPVFDDVSAGNRFVILAGNPELADCCAAAGHDAETLPVAFMAVLDDVLTTFHADGEGDVRWTLLCDPATNEKLAAAFAECRRELH
jgi:hypothetical protein